MFCVTGCKKIFHGEISRGEKQQIASAVVAIVLLGTLCSVLACSSIRTKQIILSVWQLPLMGLAMAILGKAVTKQRDSSFICIHPDIFKEFEEDYKKLIEVQLPLLKQLEESRCETSEPKEAKRAIKDVLLETLRLAIKVEWRKAQFRIVGRDFLHDAENGGLIAQNFSTLSPQKSALALFYLKQHFSYKESPSFLDNELLSDAFLQANNQFKSSNKGTLLTPSLLSLFQKMKDVYEISNAEERIEYQKMKSDYQDDNDGVDGLPRAKVEGRYSSVMNNEFLGSQTRLRKIAAAVAFILLVGSIAMIIWKSSLARELLIRKFSVQVGYLSLALVWITLVGLLKVWRGDRALLARIDDSFRSKYNAMCERSDEQAFREIFTDYVQVYNRYYSSQEKGLDLYFPLLYRNYLIYSQPIPEGVIRSFQPNVADIQIFNKLREMDDFAKVNPFYYLPDEEDSSNLFE